MARILITCFGSYGDLFPYIALGKALRDRDHEVTIGTTSIFRQKVEAEGLRFRHIRCGLDRYSTPESLRGLLQRVFDPVKGGEIFVREMMQGIEDTYQDTRDSVRQSDFVISNPFALTTPLVCRDLNITWLSTILAPMFFMSVYDPPIQSAAPWLRSVNNWSPALYRGLFGLIKKVAQGWTEPLYTFCEAQSIPAPDANPLFEGQYSPHGTLAMFPHCLATPQPDWPVNTRITGFPLFSSEEAEAHTLSKLDAFLRSGEPPLVFALGSSAVHIAPEFFRVSALIAKKLKRRAVLVTGPLDPGVEETEDILVVKYVAYSKLFHHASVIVHQGGIGTLAQAVCAEKPMLIVPFGFDQFDNAERLTRLGVAESIKRKNYTVDKASVLIERLATDGIYRQRAREVGASIKKEDGVENACIIIESMLKVDEPMDGRRAFHMTSDN